MRDFLGTMQLWQKLGPCGSDGVNRRGPCGSGVLLFATRLRQQERLCWEERGRKDSCWWAMRKVPHGFGLTGDCGSHTADGAGSLNHGLLLLFLTQYPGLGIGRGKDCASVGILKDFSILLKTLSHYS